MHYVVAVAVGFIAGLVVTFLRYHSFVTEVARIKAAVLTEASSIEQHVVGGATVAAVDVKYFAQRLRGIF